MSEMPLYPLCFEPIYKERVWGGSRLASSLGKQPPPGTVIGESWDLADLDEGQSMVANGPLSGETLTDLLAARGPELMGPAALDGDRFPLLVKYIDASQTLSVQVHPDARAARHLGGRPKSEAWYILDAEPGALLYLGLKPGTTAEALRAALAAGAAVEALLEAVPARKGDLIPVPPGTVHAIGAGILLAEVQQPSDTTYRVYDWGRVGLDGRPRALHVAEALESIRFEARVAPATGRVVDMGLFRVELVQLGATERRSLAGSGPAVLVGLEGAAELAGPAGTARTLCTLGSVILVPHVARGAWLEGGAARALLVTFPASGEGQRG